MKRCLTCDRPVEWNHLDHLSHCADCHAERERLWQAMLRRWNGTDRAPPEAHLDTLRILVSETEMIVPDDHGTSQAI